MLGVYANLSQIGLNLHQLLFKYILQASHAPIEDFICLVKINLSKENRERDSFLPLCDLIYLILFNIVTHHTYNR